MQKRLERNLNDINQLQYYKVFILKVTKTNFVLVFTFYLYYAYNIKQFLFLLHK